MRKSILVVLSLLFISGYSYPQDGYSILTSKVKKSEGLVNVYNDKGDYFFELERNSEKKVYLLKMMNLTSIDELGFFAGMNIGEMTMKFEKRNDNIDIVKINELILPDTNRFTNYGQEVTSRFGPLKVEGANKDSSKYIARIGTFFTSDVPNLQFLFQQLLGGYYSINSELTYIEQVKTFPKNVEITVNYVLNSQSVPVSSVPDSRAVNFKVRYSLIDLSSDSASKYIPRLFDTRVGYFETTIKDYSNPLRKSELTKYISRWNLQKKNPYEEISEPVKPIVYWIDRATPIEYREAIKKGVLLWNKAFEKAGFKNAVQCYVQPDSVQWDSDDIRYNVLRWQSYSTSGVAGIGPSVTNPFTGEILNASVLINSEALRFMQDEKYLFSIINAKDKLYEANFEEDKVMAVLEKMSKKSLHFCKYPSLSKNQAMISSVKYIVDNSVGSFEEIPKQFVDDYLTELVVHEIGHTLGLRHNFKSSSAYTFEELRNPQFTAENGNSSSVMDYDAPNISPPGMQQGTYWSPSVGKYDLFAIEYGYKIFPNIKKPDDEVPYLIAVASQSSNPYNVYGTDEDAANGFGPTSLDPLTQTFDLGNSPLEFAKQRVAIDKDLFKKIDKYFPQYNESYSQLNAIFAGLLSDYMYNSVIVSKYIGGAYLTKMKQGDVVNDKYPMEPVTYAEQMEALNFINEHIFEAENYLTFSPAFLKMLPASQNLFGRKDFPLNDIILNFQGGMLYRCYSPVLMKRMLEQENLSSDILTLAQLNDYLYSNIWKEVKSKTSISKTRRALQKMHLDMMIEVIVNPTAGTPEDARSMTYRILNELNKDIASFKAAGETDEFHLKECKSRIDKAMNSVIINQN